MKKVMTALRYIDEHIAKIVCLTLLGLPIILALMFAYLSTK